MKRATEMLNLIEALPDSPEKDALLLHEQIGEWEYHRDDCSVKQYTNKLTEDEKVSGETKDSNGNVVKLWKKGIWCHHCKCSAQEFKRHRKTKKCQLNRAKAEPHLQAIRKAYEKRISPSEGTEQEYEAYLQGKCRDASAPRLGDKAEDLQADREGMLAEDRKPETKPKKKLKLKKKIKVLKITKPVCDNCGGDEEVGTIQVCGKTIKVCEHCDVDGSNGEWLEQYKYNTETCCYEEQNTTLKYTM